MEFTRCLMCPKKIFISRLAEGATTLSEFKEKLEFFSYQRNVKIEIPSNANWQHLPVCRGCKVVVDDVWEFTQQIQELQCNIHIANQKVTDNLSRRILLDGYLTEQKVLLGVPDEVFHQFTEKLIEGIKAIEIADQVLEDEKEDARVQVTSRAIMIQDNGTTNASETVSTVGSPSSAVAAIETGSDNQIESEPEHGTRNGSQDKTEGKKRRKRVPKRPTNSRRPNPEDYKYKKVVEIAHKRKKEEVKVPQSEASSQTSDENGTATPGIKKSMKAIANSLVTNPGNKGTILDGVGARVAARRPTEGATTTST